MRVARPNGPTSEDLLPAKCTKETMSRQGALRWAVIVETVVWLLCSPAALQLEVRGESLDRPPGQTDDRNDVTTQSFCKEDIMKNNNLWKQIALVFGLAATGTLVVHAAAGGNGGGQGGGNKPPTESSNNLSYPAIFTGAGVTLPGTSGDWTLNGVFPTSKSYGCDKSETIGTTVYPNTSCLSSTGVPLSRDACAAGPCAGYAVDAIYWQKSAASAWQAETLGPNAGPKNVSYIDWGDNLESVSWKTSSMVRVEATPFATLGTPLLGFQMWHVSGQGTDEMWGVRGNDADDADPWVYDSSYAIIQTPAARLNIAKLVNGTSTCPTAGGTQPPSVATTWTKGSAPGSWTGLSTLHDIPFTAELNIGGKFVYGYNWQLQRDAVLPNVGKAGWWRLTFYTENNTDSGKDSVIFNDAAIPTTPPPGALPELPVQQALRIQGVSILADTGALYKPTVDTANNLTYIDICIVDGRNSK